MQQELAQTADKALAWMEQQSCPDGSYADAMPALGAYYKTPYLWAIAGRPERFGLAVDHMRKTFHGDGGFRSAVDPQASAYTSYFFNYMMGWVARGAWIGGAFDLARKACEYLAQPAGGLPQATSDTGPAVNAATRSIGTAANAALTFLYAGDMANADTCERFVRSVYDAQDSKDVFYVRTDAEGNLLTDFPESERAFSVIDLSAADQMFWYFGITMAMYGKLFELTGDRTCLERARHAFEIFEPCRPNVAGDDLTVGKVAYGAALLYRLTGDGAYLDTCRQCAQNVIQSQNEEGFWLYGRRADMRGINRTTLLDFCAEMAIWCIEVRRELAAAGDL